MAQKSDLADKIQRLQQRSVFVFIPTSGVALFSDNILFETIALIAGIIFAVTTYIDP